MAGPARRWVTVSIALAAGLLFAVAADRTLGWIAPLFDFFAHQFYEIPELAAIRRPTQLHLVRWHLMVLSVLAALGCALAPWLAAHGRRCWAVFCVAYAVRA